MRLIRLSFSYIECGTTSRLLKADSSVLMLSGIRNNSPSDFNARRFGGQYQRDVRTETFGNSGSIAVSSRT
jgi:hypothetical protein